VSILDLALLPIRIAHQVVDAVVHPAERAPAPPAELVVGDGMPSGPTVAVPSGRHQIALAVAK